MEFVKSIFHQLNNRELATIIWGIFLFLSVMALSSSVRRSFWVIIKMLFSGKIFLMLIMNTILFGILVIGIKYLQIWNDLLWKDAIFWFLASFIFLFSANKALEEKNYYKKEFFKLLKLETVIIFFFSLHTFSLIQEIIFVPIFTIIVVLQTVSSLKRNLKQIEVFLNIIMTLILLFLIGFSIKESILSPETTFSVSNLYSFAFPIGLTILYIPFLYVFSLYMAYENFFCQLKILFKDGFRLKSKLSVFLTCRLKISTVKAFHHLALNVNYVRSEDDLINTIKSFSKKT